MPRQKIIGYFFGFLALLGLAMYVFLPEGSELRLLGIVLMIFCLPVSIRYGMRQARSPAPKPAPRAAEPAPAYGPREINLTVEATFTQIVPTSTMRIDDNILDLPCLLALGSDGFRSRLWRADSVTGPWPDGEKLLLNAEFFLPERALPRFPAGTVARVMLGATVIGSVHVLRNHADERTAPANPA